jgi:site-specific DNA-methyltransferase (adenine-specific)
MLISGESNDTTIGKNSPHPCPRKLSHVRWLVERWSDLDDTIVDPFMGGGTTVKACKIAGRKVIGIEIEERFCEMAVKSIEQNVFNFSR